MNGERRLARLLEETRDLLRGTGAGEDGFAGRKPGRPAPDDGSDPDLWNRVFTLAEQYGSEPREDLLWEIVGVLYRLSRWYLDRPVTRIKGIGDARAESLDRLGIRTVRDLLYHVPRAYTDRRYVDSIREAEPGRTATLLGEVLGGRVVRGRGSRYEIHLGDDTGTVQVNFWNQAYLQDQIPPGTELFCTGKLEEYRGTKQLNNPDYEVIEDPEDLEESRGIKAIYPLTEGIHLKQLRSWIGRALDRYGALLVDCVPGWIRSEHDLPSLRRTLRNLHQPESPGRLDAARRRVVFEEFYDYQMLFALQNWSVDRVRKGRSYDRDRWVRTFVDSLPFELTGDQESALEEIQHDLANDAPMHRLLQGDVGTGKTVVAAASLLRVAENGYQTALMAPTEVLAEQHHDTLLELLADHPCEQELLIGSLDESTKRSTRERVRSGEPDLVVGTHALIQGSVEFSRLGYAVIDEQHRFGVEQRRELRDKGPELDMLVMSATPIPRSLALTAYGDLSVTTLESFPAGPKRIQTRVLEGTSGQRARVYGEVLEGIRRGERGFFVFPAIEESEEVDLTPARDSWEKAQNSRFFEDVEIGLVHGRMDREEKRREMERFREGSVQVLFATSVIEVGIDVPEASYLVVHDAEQFGLAQLHQLRGRIGRAGQNAHCYLFVDPHAAEESRERLAVLEETQDGFEVARADLLQRGIGDLAGTLQAGSRPFVLGDPWKHREVMVQARRAAERTVRESRGLQDPAVRLIREKMDRDYAEAMQYVGVG